MSVRVIQVCNILHYITYITLHILLNTHSKGEINIKQFFSEFSEPSQEKCDTEFVTCFPYINVLRKVSNDVLSSLVYTSGYVARKVLFKIQCDECKDLIGDKKRSMDLKIDLEHFKYTEILDRGGLVYPSDLLFMVLGNVITFLTFVLMKSLKLSFSN